MKITESVLALKRKLNRSQLDAERRMRQKLEFLIHMAEGNVYNKRKIAQNIGGVSANTIESWKKKYEEGGYAKLIADSTRTFILSEEIKEKTVKLMINNKDHHTFKEIYRKVKSEYPAVEYDNLLKFVKGKPGGIYEQFVKHKKQKRVFEQ